MVLEQVGAGQDLVRSHVSVWWRCVVLSKLFCLSEWKCVFMMLRNGEGGTHSWKCLLNGSPLLS